MKTVPVWACLAGAVWLFARPAAIATSSIEPAGLEQLVGQAAQIAEVDVLDRHTVLRPDGGIETRYSLSTRTPIKGALPSIQQWTLPGGVIADKGMLIPGLPSFEVGDRAIVFLSEQDSAGNDWRMPVGLEAGVYRVAMGGQGREQVFNRGSHLDSHLPAQSQDYEDFLYELLREVARQK